MESQRQSLGREGERRAAEHLERLGWTILERNWRCGDGEIDIVAYDPEASAIVVVEVKTRAGTGYGTPLEAITYAKARRLRGLAAVYMRRSRRRAPRLRVDGVGVLLTRGEWTISHAQRIDEW
jgi:putative endonuclease